MNAALHMILDAAARAPNAPALERADGSCITYGELVHRATHHARELQHAPPVIELAANRSDDFIARCLGAWLAERAWLPVDLADPRPRPRIAHRGLAYVIATSGTTGAPKLVMVGLGGLSSLLHTQIDAFALAPGARALWLHSPLFDASLSDWATALAAGATLVIPTPHALTSAAALRDELAARAITHVDLPPALLAYVDPPSPSLRVVVLGGEPCPVDRVQAIARRVRVVVVYGPTEVTVCSSLVVVDPDTWHRPLIGHPLPGVHYHVRDGELYIAGDALALGYANDPAETARRFVDVDGVRMYRTGDRVEPTPYGLAFVGRIDRERKVRGRRVDLDAIEAALRALASNGDIPRATADVVAAAADVAAADDAAADDAAADVGTVMADVAVVVRGERIIAFSSVPLDRARISAVLPAHMRPARVVVAGRALPRTPTGKLDRAALETCELPVDLAVATEPHERCLALAWCEVLGVERVERFDRWLECGGDSLARLMFHAATGVTIEGDPSFGDVVAHAVDREDALPVAECEARGRALLAQLDRETPSASPARTPSASASASASASVSASASASASASETPSAMSLATSMSRTTSTSTSDVACGGAILVTGATGFLGRALIRAFARIASGRPLVALVRDSSSRLGIETVCGDVARPYFGLDREAWDALHARVGAVVHCAATMQLGGTWDDHVAVNVGGTVECARFVGRERGGDRGRAIAWHHVSTLSVFVNTDHARGRHVASDVPRGIAYGGYAQTKIAAEAIARDWGATVYRLGLLVGEGERGQLPMTIAALRKLGCAPADARDERFDATPVEYAADVIAEGVVGGAREEHGAGGGVWHVASRRGMTCGELVARLGIAEVERRVWLERAHARAAGDADVAMAIAAFSKMRDRTLFLATGADFDVAEDAP